LRLFLVFPTFWSFQLSVLPGLTVVPAFLSFQLSYRSGYSHDVKKVRKMEAHLTISRTLPIYSIKEIAHYLGCTERKRKNIEQKNKAKLKNKQTPISRP
jgi:hypothetical protein